MNAAKRFSWRRRNKFQGADPCDRSWNFQDLCFKQSDEIGKFELIICKNDLSRFLGQTPEKNSTVKMVFFCKDTLQRRSFQLKLSIVLKDFISDVNIARLPFKELLQFLVCSPKFLTSFSLINVNFYMHNNWIAAGENLQTFSTEHTKSKGSR